MLRLKTLVVSLKSARTALEAIPPDSTINLRADLAGDIDPARLRRKSSDPLLYSLRSPGRDDDAVDCDAVRHRRLLAAAQRFDFIELEAERDLTPPLLSAIEPRRRVVSWHGGEADAASLMARFSTMAGVPAALYLLAPRARRFAQTTDPLRFLSGLGRRDVISYDAGPAGFWTRLIAPQWGARLVFAEVDEQPADSDAPSISALVDDYGLPELRPVKMLYGIVGRDVFRSASPRLHNTKLRADGRAALFLPFRASEFNDVRDGMKALEVLSRWGLDLRGLTVMAPFKEAALALADSRSASAERAGAANLLVHSNGEWRADTTDPQGVADAIAERRLPVRGRAAVVVGCGGAGRAVATALADAGARVTLANRGMSNGRVAAHRLALPFVPLSQVRPEDYALVVNATPLGADGETTPVDPKRLDPASVVIDLVYRRGDTPLVAGARARGMIVIDGFEVLAHQVRHQYVQMANVDGQSATGHHSGRHHVALQRLPERHF